MADGNTAERLAPAVGLGLEEKGKLEGGAGSWRPRGMGGGVRGILRERVEAGGALQQGLCGKGGGAGGGEVKRDGVRA